MATYSTNSRNEIGKTKQSNKRKQDNIEIAIQILKDNCFDGDTFIEPSYEIFESVLKKLNNTD